MGWRFKKAVNLGGLRLNLSRRGPWIQLGISTVSDGNFSGRSPLHLDYGSTDRNLVDEVFRFGASARASRSNAELAFTYQGQYNDYRMSNLMLSVGITYPYFKPKKLIK